MPGKTASRKRKGTRHVCSYGCGKVHRKGKKNGDSCRGKGKLRTADR